MKYAITNGDSTLQFILMTKSGGIIPDLSLSSIVFSLYNKSDVLFTKSSVNSDELELISEEDGIIIVHISYDDVSDLTERDYDYTIKVDEAVVDKGILRLYPYNDNNGACYENSYNTLSSKTWEELK